MRGTTLPHEGTFSDSEKMKGDKLHWLERGFLFSFVCFENIICSSFRVPFKLPFFYLWQEALGKYIEVRIWVSSNADPKTQIQVQVA